MIDRKLEIFRMAAMLGNFTETAAALGMSQPNVTHQLARLEEEMGVKLFLRDGRNVLLTPAGKELAGHCGQLFSEAEKIIRSVRCAAEKLRYHRIGGTMTAGGYLLPGLLASYMKARAGLSLDLRIANTREIGELLVARELDLALVEGPFEQNCFLSEEYCGDELVPVFAPDSGMRSFSLAQYIRDGTPLILREAGSGTRWYFDRFLADRSLPVPEPRQILEVNSFDALKLLVRQGLGMTIISPLAIRDELAAGTLACGRFTEGTVARKLNFIYLPGADHRFVGDFIRYCRKQPVPGTDKPQSPRLDSGAKRKKGAPPSRRA